MVWNRLRAGSPSGLPADGRECYSESQIDRARSPAPVDQLHDVALAADNTTALGEHLLHVGLLVLAPVARRVAAARRADPKLAVDAADGERGHPRRLSPPEPRRGERG